jgi:outer membrane lipoprotein SlyB
MQYLTYLRSATTGRLIPIFAGLLLISGCINPSKDVYEAHAVGRMIDTSEATVVTSRIISIKEESRGYGPLAGAAVGATGAGLSSVGGHNAGWVVALGGLLGAGAGALAERFGRSREGIEYIVRTSDGRVMTLVQNRGSAEAPIPAGTTVLVQHGGGYTRVIEKPEILEEQWRNPDAPGSSGTGGGDVQQQNMNPVESGTGRQMQGGAGLPSGNPARAPNSDAGGSASAPDQ